jgi:hypothetical protein
MSAVLIVPADFVPVLRSGLLGEWGFAAEDLSTLALQMGSDASSRTYREALELFDASRALLDLVGWRLEHHQAEVCVDLGASELYPAIVLRALTGERAALVAHLEEMPRRTNESLRQIVRSRIGALGDLIASAEDKAETLKPRSRRLKRRVPLRSRPGLHHSRRG